MLTGLLYAMKGEIESLLPEGAEPEKTVAGVPFYRIRENVVACCGGVGKVNAAMATQLFIDLYAPGRIVNVGVAGCFENVPIGTLVLADRFMQHDVDTSGIGDPVGLVSTVNRMDFPTAELEKAKDAMDKMCIRDRFRAALRVRAVSQPFRLPFAPSKLPAPCQMRRDMSARHSSLSRSSGRMGRRI